MNGKLNRLRFLENYSLFDNKAWTAYHNVKRYVEANYRELKEHSKDIDTTACGTRAMMDPG